MLLQAGLFLLSVGAIVQVRSQIVGGCEAPNHKYPYMVLFRYHNGIPFCGGAIISNRWILSAAHCFEDCPLRTCPFSILAGTNCLDKKGVVYQAESIETPPGYVYPWVQDIALVRVKSEMVLKGFVATIALPTHNLKDYTQKAVVTGWGSMYNISGDYPNALQAIELNILSMDRCKAQSSSITDAHLCSLNKRGQGLCFGDSGGPLVINGELVGIASRVIPCAQNIPDVFTRVWSNKKWIVDTISNRDGSVKPRKN